jgi:glycosyltransferase involved in cell wall biosynthesis
LKAGGIENKLFMKVALVHDHLAQDGGAESVLRAFADIYPDAPIYTLLYEEKNALKHYNGKRIETSIIQKMPGGVKHYQWYMPFMPMAVEFYDLRDFDLVLSDASGFAKGVITAPHTLHICYCHTPTRYLWDYTHQYINELSYNKYFKKIISLVLNYIRIWDMAAADRVDFFIANSLAVQKRIKKYYKKDSKLIYPPVAVDDFYLSELHKIEKENYFLIGCRLTPYKRVDIVIEAFKELGENYKLKIFGDGVDMKRLSRIAEGSSNIEFLGRVDDRKRAELFSLCKAFIHPQEEDFGIAAVEAMASGRPVIAFDRGGAKETVIPGKTGIFFNEQTSECVKKAILEFDFRNYDSIAVREHSLIYSTKRFRAEIEKCVKTEYEKFLNS